MIRVLSILAGVFLLSAVLLGGALAFESVYVDSSGAKTASANILAQAGYFYGIQADRTAGAGRSIFTVYDEAGTATSGTVLLQWTYAATLGDNESAPMFNPPIAVNSGIYVAQSVSAGTWTWQGYSRAR